MVNLGQPHALTAQADTFCSDCLAELNVREIAESSVAGIATGAFFIGAIKYLGENSGAPAATVESSLRKTLAQSLSLDEADVPGYVESVERLISKYAFAENASICGRRAAQKWCQGDAADCSQLAVLVKRARALSLDELAVDGVSAGQQVESAKKAPYVRTRWRVVALVLAIAAIVMGLLLARLNFLDHVLETISSLAG
jgi:hypothetical protein